MRQYKYVTIIAAIALIAIFAVAFYRMGGDDRAQNAAMLSLSTFSDEIGELSLIGDQDTVRGDVEARYAPFVTKDVLSLWLADLSSAPGQDEEGNIPKIEVIGLAPQGSGYVVQAEEVYTKPGTDPAEVVKRVPVVIFIVRDEGTWKIAVYERQIRQPSA